MQQLSLELEEFLIQPSFEHTVITQPNQQLFEYLQNLPARLEGMLCNFGHAEMHQLKNEWLYIWGETAAGKTHLLQAMYHFCKNAALPVIFLSPKDHENAFILHDQAHIYCIDDVDFLNDAQQMALFNLINQTRIQPLNAIIMTGQKAPMAYEKMREDLRTRLGWGLVYHLKSLDITAQKEALLHYGQQKKLEIDASTIDWLYKNLDHLLNINADNHSENTEENLKSPQVQENNHINYFKDILNLLDTYSLMQKKAPTLPLIKKMLAEMV